MLSRSRCAVVFKSGRLPGDSLHCRATADGILSLPYSCFIFLLHRAHTALEISIVSCNVATVVETLEQIKTLAKSIYENNSFVFKGVSNITPIASCQKPRGVFSHHVAREKSYYLWESEEDSLWRLEVPEDLTLQ